MGEEVAADRGDGFVAGGVEADRLLVVGPGRQGDGSADGSIIEDEAADDANGGDVGEVAELPVHGLREARWRPLHTRRPRVECPFGSEPVGTPARRRRYAW